MMSDADLWASRLHKAAGDEVHSNLENKIINGPGHRKPKRGFEVQKKKKNMFNSAVKNKKHKPCTAPQESRQKRPGIILKKQIPCILIISCDNLAAPTVNLLQFFILWSLAVYRKSSLLTLMLKLSLC
jgi:hypothetical protein